MSDVAYAVLPTGRIVALNMHPVPAPVCGDARKPLLNTIMATQRSTKRQVVAYTHRAIHTAMGTTAPHAGAIVVEYDSE